MQQAVCYDTKKLQMESQSWFYRDVYTFFMFDHVFLWHVNNAVRKQIRDLKLLPFTKFTS